MNKIYDVTLGIEAGSREEAEQKLLRFQKIAVEYNKQSNSRLNAGTAEAELSPLKAAIGLLAVVGLGWLNDILKPKKIRSTNTNVELEMKLHKYNWQKEWRKRQKEEELQRKNLFAFGKDR